MSDVGEMSERRRDGWDACLHALLARKRGPTLALVRRVRRSGSGLLGLLVVAAGCAHETYQPDPVRVEAPPGQVFEDCVSRDYRRLVLCGTGDLCEIAIIAATEYDVTLVGVYDRNFDRPVFRGLKVSRQFEDFAPVDAAIVTAMPNAQATADILQAYLPPDRILAARMLHVGRNPPPSKSR